MTTMLAVALQQMSDDRLEWHMWNWAQWHNRSHFGAIRSHWFPGRASGGIGKSGSSDFDAMVGTVDSRCAAAVEACLDDCTPAERAAVHHVQLGAVYTLPVDLDATYADALETVRDGLVKRCIL